MLVAVLLLASPLIRAQDPGPDAAPAKQEQKAAPAKEDEQAKKPDDHVKEPFRVTITFKTMEGGKVTTQRSYTLVATTDQMPPRIRDNSKIPVRVGDHDEYVNSNTDVDFTGLRKVDGAVFVGLSISTESFSLDNQASEKAQRPVEHSHSYTLTPTLPLYRTVTVYSATDSVNGTDVEVQVRVEPLIAK
jgi:hypothetical protein